MADISEEQQAAMALKLTDNVKQLIVETVREDYNNGGPLRALIDSSIISRILDINGGSAMHTAVKQIVSNQMAKY